MTRAQDATRATCFFDSIRGSQPAARRRDETATLDNPLAALGREVLQRAQRAARRELAAREVSPRTIELALESRPDADAPWFEIGGSA